MKKTIIYSLSFIFFAATIVSSCKAVKNTNKTQRGAGIGVAAGAILGAVIGNNVNDGNSQLGALIGGAVGGVAGGLIGNKMDKQAREIQEALPGAEVERVGEGIKLVLGENAVRFDTSKSTLTTQAESNLDKLVPVFNSYADTDIVIYGYTDSTGNVDSNQILSEQRAASVKNYLANKGVNIARFTTMGFGIADPIADNETEDGRSKNRRVEFTITANEKMIENAQKESGQ
jgi:outer membrane protein OmpA-like peptidoglycan-associated protein